VRDQGELERHIRILAELLDKPIALERRSFQNAVEDFAVATDLAPAALDYRLKTWFLLLVFDGLNLFCAKYGLRELVSLDEKTMCYLSSSSFPSSVQAAAREVLSYLRGYPLKYFLRPEAKIRAAGARKLLVDLVPDAS
jgi:hypothetical protein